MVPCPFAVIGFSAFFVLSLLCNQNTEIAAAAAVLFAAAFLVSAAVRQIRRERVIPLSLASCAIACSLLAGALNFEYAPAIEFANKTCRITCQLTDGGTHSYGADYYIARILEVNGKSADMRVRLRLSSPLDAEPYDIVRGDFHFYSFDESGNAVRNSLRAERVFIGAYPDDGYAVENISADEKPFAYKFYAARKAIERAIYRFMPDENGGLSIALLTGEKDGISDETLSAFRKVGTSHIICVSGMHLAIWAMFLLKLAQKLRIGIKVASAASAVIVLGYMALTGFPYSVVRSGIMCLVFLLGNIISREKVPINSLGFAVAVILLINPFAADDFSLRLSFLSTLGIIVGYSAAMPRINSFLMSRRRGLRLSIARYTVMTLFTTLCAVTFTLPVTLPNQTGMNFVCFAANLLTILPATVCMVLSGVTAIFSFLPLSEYTAALAARLSGLFSRYIISITTKLAELNAFEFSYDKDLARLWLAGALILSAFSVLLIFRGKKHIALTAVAICVTFASMLGASALLSAKTARITVTDVGNGTAVIVSKGSEGVLLGCGGDSYNASNEIAYALKSSGVTYLKLLLIPRKNETESAFAVDIMSDIMPEAVAHNTLPWGAELLVNNCKCVGASFDKSEILPGVFIKSVVSESSCYAVVEFNNSKTLVQFYPDSEILPADSNADILICRSDVTENLDLSKYDLTVISGADKALCVQNELLSRRIPAAATAGDGNIVLLTRGNGAFEALREN